MYSKFIMMIIFEKIIEKKENFSKSNNFNNKNNLFDIEDESFKKNFY